MRKHFKAGSRRTAKEIKRARIAAELEAGKKEMLVNIQYLIRQKEAEVKALECKIKQLQGIVKTESGEKRINRFDRFARKTRKTLDVFSSIMQWFKGVFFRGMGGKKGDFSKMMNSRFQSRAMLEEKKAEAVDFIRKLNGLKNCVERNPEFWVGKLREKKTIKKILTDESF